MEQNNKMFLDFVSEEVEVQTIVKSVGSYGKLASYSGYDFSSLGNDIKVTEIMTLYYIDVLEDKKVVSKECANNLKILYRELMRLNRVYGQLLVKDLFSEEENENKEEIGNIQKLIDEIQKVLQSYGILNEDGYLDFKLSIPTAIETCIEKKILLGNISLSDTPGKGYQDIMKKVKTVK